MAARTWCSTERIIAPHLLVGLNDLLSPPIHHLGSALKAAFPNVVVLAFQSAVAWRDDGSAHVTAGFSYNGNFLAVTPGDVERLLSALQTPTVEHRCPVRDAATLNWIKCSNESCPYHCASVDAEPGWFLVGCCGLAHLPQSVLDGLEWQCGRCTT